MPMDRGTPDLVRHCVAAVAKQHGGDTDKAFAICVAQLQKNGYLKPGTMELTAAGKKKEQEHESEPDAGKKLASYEKLLKANRVQEANEPLATYLGYDIDALSSYDTPYYYAVGPKPLGSFNHFPTLKRLKNYMDKLVKQGKLVPLKTEGKKKSSKSLEWDGRETSVGTNYGKVTPRLVGPAAAKFKKQMGVCMTDGCMKIDGHEGPHTQPKTEANRKELEDFVWKKTHRDFKGTEGGRSIMGVNPKTGGSQLKYLSSMGDEELLKKAKELGYKAESRVNDFFEALLDRTRSSGYEALPTTVARKHEVISQTESSMDLMRRLAGITPKHADRVNTEGKAAFQCMECGKKFSKPVDECPKCGGSDIDVAP